MNIQQMIESGSNALFVVSGGDLKEFALALIAEAAAKPVEAEEKYLTSDEVCDILHVSSNTLWRWGKSGYLVPNKVGRTPMYRQSDIDILRGGINK